MLRELQHKPDYNAIELAILDKWAREDTFNLLREKNRDGPRFSFIDGPVTANKPLAIHTTWGRSLKDVFQRYKALQGFHQRYQNGFDCQGLWIEVGVERELGLNSKHDIEQYGLARFADKCRDVVIRSAEQLKAGSQRLGQWMDWGADYYTFSDTNIEYIWKFLSIVHERGWLYQGQRATEWCPRCGTSISAHELVGSYVDREDHSLSVRFPLTHREGEAIVIWTTTPWTLPANVAVAVHPDAEYGKLPNGDWMAVDSQKHGQTHEHPHSRVHNHKHSHNHEHEHNHAHTQFQEIKKGSELVGWEYRGPFDDLEPASEISHQVIAWDEVNTENGTGVVHIAPGCGTEDFELGKSASLPVIMPVDEAGKFFEHFGWLAGREAHDVADDIIADLRSKRLLVESGTITHRYPECWRCHTPLIFRISNDWYIAVDDIRPAMREANNTVEWTPEYIGKRMDDWLVNMSDWNISRRRYYGLPLPFYPCSSCGHLTVVKSKTELAERAVNPDAISELQELRRPWIDNVQIRCPECDTPVDRISEVGDVWLDAGIVPFSTLGWENPSLVESGFGRGAAKGLTSADLPDHSYWEEWFPADWVSEMREQTRLWFYAQSFMSVILTGRSPYRKVLSYEKMLDGTGREMHGSWGNMLQAQDAFTEIGADVMRWLVCAHPPHRNLLFSFQLTRDVQRKLLTLWNTTSFLIQYANIARYTPTFANVTHQAMDAAGDIETSFDKLPYKPTDTTSEDCVDTTSGGHASHRILDRWIVARTQNLAADMRSSYESYMTSHAVQAYESYIDDLSNWYVRCSRRRFWDGDQRAIATLWWCLTTSLRTISPIAPFLAEHLWGHLVTDEHLGSDEFASTNSIFLAGWPAVDEPDHTVIEDMKIVRQIVDLGRQARAKANHRMRQPLRKLVVGTGDHVETGDHDSRNIERYSSIIADELRVKEISFAEIKATELTVRPNLQILGPRLGAKVQQLKTALEAGDFEQLPDGGFLVEGYKLTSNEVLVQQTDKKGWSVASNDSISVALNVHVDDELLLEGKVNDAIHSINGQRKQLEFALTDRIHLQLASSDAELMQAKDLIAAETLAVSVEVGESDTTKIELATSPPIS